MSCVVSVILTTYNRPQELRRAVVSVLNQTFKDFELIIVDDASDINVESVVESFDDEKISFIKHETNQGGSAARNTGIYHSSGEYIAFLDDDDIWVKTKLETQLSHMKRENCSITYSDFEFVSNYSFVNKVRKLLPTERTEKPSGGKDLIPYILSGELSLGGFSTIMVEKAIVDEIDGLNEDFDRLQDWEFVIRILELTNIDYINEELVVKTGYNPPSGESIEESWAVFCQEFSEYIEEASHMGFDPELSIQFTIGHAYLRDGYLRTGIERIPISKIVNIKSFLRFILSIGIGLRNCVKRYL